MELKLTVDLYTDGDFHVEKIDEPYNKESYQNKDVVINYKTDTDHEYFGINLTCTGDHNYCRYVARNILEQLICNIRVNKTHYYLINYLYEFINSALLVLWNEEDINYDEFFQVGNYESSEIILTIKH